MCAWSTPGQLGRGAGEWAALAFFMRPQLTAMFHFACVCVQLYMCVSVAAGVEACTIFVALIAFRLHAASYE